MLHLVFGCMYSGKSKQLVEDTRAYSHARKLVLSHTLTGNDPVVRSRYGSTAPCLKLDNLMLVSHRNYDVYFIDEAQFFVNLVPFVNLCLRAGRVVHVYGLNGDFQGRAMGHMHELIPHADTITHLRARCACGNKAIYSQKQSVSTARIDVASKYKPVCRRCWTV